MSHYINKCEHGQVMGQCRCPSNNKYVRIVPCDHETGDLQDTAAPFEAERGVLEE